MFGLEINSSFQIQGNADAYPMPDTGVKRKRKVIVVDEEDLSESGENDDFATPSTGISKADSEEESEEFSKTEKKRQRVNSQSQTPKNTKLLKRVSKQEEDVVQELSLQNLSFRRVDKYLDEPTKNLPLIEIIKGIVKKYNQSKKLTEHKTKKPERGLRHHAYKVQENNQGYQLRVYACMQKQKSTLTRQLEKRGTSKLFKRKGTDYLLFYFREEPVREIVVATTGNGWQILRKCIHYEYPTNIAKRIANPERIIEITRRCLVGPGIQERLTNPEGHELYKISTLYYLFESFKCEVKKDSSIMELKDFSDSPPVINIATGIVRVQKKIPLETYPALLDLFSRYMRGEKTYTIGEEKKEELPDPLLEFINFLQPSNETSKPLNALLVGRIFKAYKAEREQTVLFRHKYLQDYLSASSYSIKFAPEQGYYSLDARPYNIEEILDFLDDAVFDNAESLLEAFEKIHLSFKKGGETKESSLIDYLEGEVRSSNGTTYFKIRGMWYKLKADYQALLQQDFNHMLNKTLIDREEEKLPRAWLGNSRKGKLTEKVIKEKLGISAGIKNYMKELKTTQVCYINKDQIKNRHLSGEILDHPLIKKYQQDIETQILKFDSFSAEEEEGLFGEDTSLIFAELRKKRSILDNKGYVINPILPSKLKKDKKLLGVLVENYRETSGNRETEEAYNRSYLYDQRNTGRCYGPDSGYLVLDQICPFNIELCDIVYYSPNKTYLYHVKEEFGQDTRNACSQILNAAKLLRSALSVRQSHNCLQELWRMATVESHKGYLGKVKEQMEALEQEGFFNIFYKRDISFVYAFLEKPNHSLLQDARLPTRLQVNHLNTIKSLTRKKQAYDALVNQGYLDVQGRLTGKFYASSKERFTLKEFEKESKSIYESLTKYRSASKSTLAKFDLLHLAREIQSLGFEFKICQIKQAEIGKTTQQITQESILTDLGEGKDT